MRSTTTAEGPAAPAVADRRQWAARRAWGLSAAATGLWVVVVASTGMAARVAGHWESAVTMLFGSFLAGSTPEGGGAVAFPVFTKLLDVPSPVARTFGLSIQSFGMGMAVIAIILYGRHVHVRAAIVGSVAAITGFLVSLVLFGEPDELFWPPSIGTDWVKATFTIVLATTSVMMVRQLRQHRAGFVDLGHDVDLAWTRRFEALFVAFALLGGVLSSLTGTGANIVVFLFLVVLLGTNPKVALPTSIIVMAAVSIVGFVLLGLIDGQLDVVIEGDRVVSVGGEATDLPAAQNDLLGLWPAAVPVVIWGAPLGSLVASRVRESWLVIFVAVLAAVEVTTTFLLLPELRTDAALLAYLALGLAIFPASLLALRRYRYRLFGMP